MAGTERLYARGDVEMMVGPKPEKNKLVDSANGSYSLHAKSNMRRKAADMQAEQRSLVIWRRPFKTLEYALKDLFYHAKVYARKLLECRWTVGLVVMTVAVLSLASNVPGVHQRYLHEFSRLTWWYGYWVGLGVLSSVGFGTGLHTFVLYLGPHIVSVALAAQECGGLNFPEPPYPDEIVCPDVVDERWATSFWNIMAKVRWEAVAWGLGTALGELPPYFMARAARLSGQNPDNDDELREFEELQRKKDNPELMTFVDRAKLFVENVVDRVGFLGIFVCASVPNPLFDLAGITCGHFLVPFWTFFGATVLGKAVAKVHLQKVFVIMACDERIVDAFLSPMRRIPWLHDAIKRVLAKEKAKYHKTPGAEVVSQGGSIVSSLFEKIVMAMILYFLVSIINSLAQNHHKRLMKMAGKKMASD
ncbi:vacuole membrane protein 1 isoform X2 [Bacillus rossius redtenbacheri]|uniref:vacuole membrane protein 1 isoform X2 n=1 Tax=Bacillus rossius redtenbacheri TaxID=93214 RepID=UPI002FDE1426